jgi:hypothetical protein
MAIRYLKTTLVDGTQFILRVTHESPQMLSGVEVDAEGDEVVPRGTNAEGRRYHQRVRHVQRSLIKRTAEMRMNPTYATLEAVPATKHATKRSAAADPSTVQQLRKDARLWWKIAKAEARARFSGRFDAMERAIAAEEKLIALGETPPRRPKGFEE